MKSESVSGVEQISITLGSSIFSEICKNWDRDWIILHEVWDRCTSLLSNICKQNFLIYSWFLQGK